MIFNNILNTISKIISTIVMILMILGAMFVYVVIAIIMPPFSLISNMIETIRSRTDT